MKRIAIILAATALLSAPAYAQSSQFTLGKWVEVHNAILKELNRSYVDSLEVVRWIHIPCTFRKRSRRTSR